MPSDEWTTPKPFFDRLNQIWRFDWDLAASHENHLLPNYYTEEQNALAQQWINICGFLNPPYSQLNTHPWAETAYHAARSLRSTIVMLIPNNRGETRMWHDWCMKATRWIWIKGRLKFGDPDWLARWIEFSHQCKFQEGKHGYVCSHAQSITGTCGSNACPGFKQRTNPRDGSVLVVFESNHVGSGNHGGPLNESMVAYQ